VPAVLVGILPRFAFYATFIHSLGRVRTLHWHTISALPFRQLGLLRHYLRLTHYDTAPRACTPLPSGIATAPHTFGTPFLLRATRPYTPRLGYAPIPSFSIPTSVEHSP